MGLIIYDTSGNESWNSDTVSGGVIVHVGRYAKSDTATVTFPAFPGRPARIIPMAPGASASFGASLDDGLGYPRLTVTTASFSREFAVVVT